MTEQLRGGAITEDRRLDRLPQFDERSRSFPVRTMVADKRPRSYTWGFPPGTDPQLDQGQEGACVGFGWANELALRPKPVPGITNGHARGIYFAAQKIDPWEGGAYPGAVPFMEGSSVLSGADVVKNEFGLMPEYRWAFGLLDAVLAIGYVGPGVAGTKWTTGMRDTDADGFLNVDGHTMGGHAYAVRGVRVRFIGKGRTAADIDLWGSYVIIRNSWGKGWGMNGDAKIRLADFDKLLMDDGEFCVPTKRLIA